MEKLLILGDTFGVKSILAYCKEKHIHTIITDYHTPERSANKRLSDEYWMISITDLEQLEQKCREEGVTGVIACTHDLCLDMALELSQRLGLPFYTDAETRIFERSKDHFKEMCEACGLQVAPDYSDLAETPEKIPYPVIVKPIDSSSNRGQSTCWSAEDFPAAVDYALSFSEKKKIVVEKFLKGEELFVTYTMNKGEIALSLLCGVYTNEDQPNRCYSITCNRSKHLQAYLDKVNDKVVTMLHKMGCEKGMAFVSCIVEDGEFYFLEMGHRLPGGMIQIGFKEISGIDYAKIFTDFSIYGESDLPVVAQTGEYEKIACSYIIWAREGTIEKMDGAAELEREGFAVNSFNKPGCRIFGQTLMNAAVYVVCFSAENNEDFVRKVNRVNDTLVCDDENGNDMLIRFNNFQKVFEK